ncbi:hypothetical protein FOZ63_005314, partial [Perkinsus olseni]
VCRPLSGSSKHCLLRWEGCISISIPGDSGGTCKLSIADPSTGLVTGSVRNGRGALHSYAEGNIFDRLCFDGEPLWVSGELPDDLVQPSEETVGAFPPKGPLVEIKSVALLEALVYSPSLVAAAVSGGPEAGYEAVREDGQYSCVAEKLCGTCREVSTCNLGRCIVDNIECRRLTELTSELVKICYCSIGYDIGLLSEMIDPQWTADPPLCEGGAPEGTAERIGSSCGDFEVSEFLAGTRDEPGGPVDRDDQSGAERSTCRIADLASLQPLMSFNGGSPPPPPPPPAPPEVSHPIEQTAAASAPAAVVEAAIAAAAASSPPPPAPPQPPASLPTTSSRPPSAAASTATISTSGVNTRLK